MADVAMLRASLDISQIFGSILFTVNKSIDFDKDAKFVKTFGDIFASIKSTLKTSKKIPQRIKNVECSKYKKIKGRKCGAREADFCKITI